MFELLNCKKKLIMLHQSWIVKIFALGSIPFFFYDIEIIFLICSFLFLHFGSGLKTILKDYFHNLNLLILTTIFLRLLNIEFLRYILEFFL